MTTEYLRSNRELVAAAALALAIASACESSDDPSDTETNTGGAESSGRGGSNTGGAFGESGGTSGAGDAGGAGAAGAVGGDGGGANTTCDERHIGDRCQFLKFQGIGVIPGHVHSEVNKLSRDGAVAVGSSWEAKAFFAREARTAAAVRFDVVSGALEMVTPVEVLPCEGLFINADGNWLGGDCGQPFQFTEAGFELIAPEVIGGKPFGASLDGSTLVGAKDETAFRWTSAGLRTLECPQWRDEPPSAVVANADGSVVAVRCDRGELYRWTAKDGMKALPVPAEWAINRVTGISDDGQELVGICDASDSLSPTSTFGLRWHGDILETVDAQLQGCNSTCGIVFDDSCIWDHGEKHCLTELLEPTPDFDGWKNLRIAAISNDAKVIAGSGQHDGHNEGWIAHVR